MVAAQLLFTVGVTCALAFELPSEPIYKITQKLRENLYGIKDEEEEETTTAAPTTMADDTYDHDHGDDPSRIDYNSQRLNYVNSNMRNNYDSMNKHNYYYSANYNNNNKYYHKPLSPNNYFSDKSDNYYNNYSHNKSDKLSNQSPLFVTPSPLNGTKSVWTSAIKT